MDDQRRLTPRQREVLVLYAQGHRLSAIARMLGISPETARTHREDIVSNLNVQSIVQAAVIGIARGEIVLDDENVVAGAPSPIGELQAA